MAQDKVNIPVPDSSNSLPAAARGPEPCTPSGRYNRAVFDALGSRTMENPSGDITEDFDRGMWPAVDWRTDEIINSKIKLAVESERERCAKIAEAVAAESLGRERGRFSDDDVRVSDGGVIAAKIRSGE